MLREVARVVGGEELARKLWGRIEVIGDVAVLRKPPDVRVEELEAVARELLRKLKYVKSVWASVTPVEGPYRVRNYVHLAGEERSLTIYKEHGCLFKVDIRDVYISPALNYEHLRIAKQVKAGEVVINMFAGIGAFSIIIGKISKPRKVYSIDLNPKAYELMVENVRINKLEGIVIPLLGDAAEVVGKLGRVADRVLMPLPELALRYFPVAVNALKGEGVIHVYDFISSRSKNEALLEGRRKYELRMKELKLEGEVSFSRVVRSVGPRMYQVVLDIRLSSA